MADKIVCRVIIERDEDNSMIQFCSSVTNVIVGQLCLRAWLVFRFVIAMASSIEIYAFLVLMSNIMMMMIQMKEKNKERMTRMRMKMRMPLFVYKNGH